MLAHSYLLTAVSRLLGVAGNKGCCSPAASERNDHSNQPAKDSSVSCSATLNPAAREERKAANLKLLESVSTFFSLSVLVSDHDGYYQ